MAYIVIFGNGYCGRNIAQFALLKSCKVFVTTRDKSSIKETEDISLIDCSLAALEQIIDDVTHIIISAPPGSDGDQILPHFSDLLKNAPKLQWIGYLSSSSVYGDHEGNIVNESSICRPQKQAGKNRLKAENQWRNFAAALNISLNIFRLSAIYGYGSSAFDRISKPHAKSIVKDNHLFSRIHIDDISQIIMKAMEKNLPYEIFNLCDDKPCNLAEINNYAAQLMKLPPIEVINFDEAEISDKMKDFYNSSKIISNQKIKYLLNVKLKFPSYKEGLTEIFATMQLEKT